MIDDNAISGLSAPIRRRIIGIHYSKASTSIPLTSIAATVAPAMPLAHLPYFTMTPPCPTMSLFPIPTRGVSMYTPSQDPSLPSPTHSLMIPKVTTPVLTLAPTPTTYILKTSTYIIQGNAAPTKNPITIITTIPFLSTLTHYPFLHHLHRPLTPGGDVLCCTRLLAAAASLSSVLLE